MEKTWREAKPKWAVDAAEKEIAGMKRRLALRWPDESRPAPVEFQWGEYDRLKGTPEEGEYFYHSGIRVYSLRLRKKQEGDTGWKEWRFMNSVISRLEWSDRVQRGPLYSTTKEAQLAALWSACDTAAADLEKAWQAYINERGYI